MSDHVNTHTGRQVLYLVPHRTRTKRICSEHRLHVEILLKQCKKQFSTNPLGSFKIMACVEGKGENWPKKDCWVKTSPPSHAERRRCRCWMWSWWLWLQPLVRPRCEGSRKSTLHLLVTALCQRGRACCSTSPQRGASQAPAQGSWANTAQLWEGSFWRHIQQHMGCRIEPLTAAGRTFTPGKGRSV